MTAFDNRNLYATQAKTERRLRDIQQQLVGPVVTVQGVAALLKQLDPELAQNLPECVHRDEFEHLVLWLGQAGEDLQAVLDKLALQVNPN